MVDKNWGLIITNAQHLISLHQELYNVPLSTTMQFSLSASAYLLFLASSSDEILPQNRKDLAIASAVAFAMSGDFSASGSLIQEQIKSNYPLNNALRVALSISAPSLLPYFAESIDCNPYQEFIKIFRMYLDQNSNFPVKFSEVYEVFVECIVDCLDNYTSYENSLLRCTRFTLYQHHQKETEY